MRGTLRDEVSVFLRERGPATSTEIAYGVQSRRADVDALLRADSRFLRVLRPEGGRARGAYWNLSERVLRGSDVSVASAVASAVVMSDKEFLAAVLADGEWHSLTEILSRSFAERGVGLTVHSRASDLRNDLRVRGLTVENRTTAPVSGHRVVSEYRIAPLTEEQAA